MRLLQASLIAMLLFAGVSCSSVSKPNRHATRISSVKTTAYTHTESDHIKFGAKTAIGTSLRYGRVRSAATDWSVYPLGTIFQIEGQPYIYQVDDYGSALVGTNTIDLYEPTKADMKQWGARNVNIRVLKWGSFSQSLSVMKPRTGAGAYIRRMVDRIQKVKGAHSSRSS